MPRVAFLQLRDSARIDYRPSCRPEIGSGYQLSGKTLIFVIDLLGTRKSVR